MALNNRLCQLLFVGDVFIEQDGQLTLYLFNLRFDFEFVQFGIETGRDRPEIILFRKNFVFHFK